MDALMKAMAALAKAIAKAPPGYSPIPNSKHGGYHKFVGGKWKTWYADIGHAGHPTERLTDAGHAIGHADHPMAGRTHHVVHVPWKDGLEYAQSWDPRALELTGTDSHGTIVVPESPGVRMTSLSDISGLPAHALGGADKERMDHIREGHDHGTLPPIDVEVLKNGHIKLVDGNHRLTSARRHGVKSISVNWIFR